MGVTMPRRPSVLRDASETPVEVLAREPHSLDLEDMTLYGGTPSLATTRMDPIVAALVAGLRSIERQRSELPANVVPLRGMKRTAA
jgi:hypothetical protein